VGRRNKLNRKVVGINNQVQSGYLRHRDTQIES